MNDHGKDGGPEDPAVSPLTQATASPRVDAAGFPDKMWWLQGTALADRIHEGDFAWEFVRAEMTKAMAKYPPYNSMHEAFGVIAEEFYELLQAMHANNLQAFKDEAKQVAATCVRAMAELGDGYRKVRSHDS